MKSEQTAIDGPFIITPDVYGDDRGFFVENFNTGRYADIIGDDVVFAQDNISRSKKGVLRGLHFQRDPFAQGKLVSVLSGSVFDVAVDVRRDSPTYGQYVHVTLRAPEMSDEGMWQWQQFWIPPGFAHGFLALEDDTTFAYKCTNLYAPEHDAGVLWNDPEIGIVWPEIDGEYLISEKDTQHPTLKEL